MRIAPLRALLYLGGRFPDDRAIAGYDVVERDPSRVGSTVLPGLDSSLSSNSARRDRPMGEPDSMSRSTSLDGVASPQDTDLKTFRRVTAHRQAGRRTARRCGPTNCSTPGPFRLSA